MKYNYEFETKYLSIEADLLQKIKNGEDAYNEKDVKEICHSLYQHELLQVCSMSEYDDKQYSTIMNNVWQQIKENTDILEILELFQINMLKSYSKECNEMAFYFLFNYHLFPYIHNVVSSYLQYGKIDMIKKNELIAKINNI